MAKSEAQTYADRLAAGDLSMDSDEYNELDPALRDEAYEIYQRKSEMTEKQREKAARSAADDHNNAAPSEGEIAVFYRPPEPEPSNDPFAGAVMTEWSVDDDGRPQRKRRRNAGDPDRGGSDEV